MSVVDRIKAEIASLRSEVKPYEENRMSVGWVADPTRPNKATMARIEEINLEIASAERRLKRCGG